MKSILLTTIFFILVANSIYAQPKDTINGKVKSIREQLVFLEDSVQNRKLFSTEGDYGHNGFISETYTKNRFEDWWYNSYWTHYINYAKTFDADQKLLKEAWYYKNQKVLESTENSYGTNGKLVSKVHHSYQPSKTVYQYDKDNNLIFAKNTDTANNSWTREYTYNKKKQLVSEIYVNFKNPQNVRKEYVYDAKGNLIELKHFDEDGQGYGTKFEFDAQNRKTKVIEHSPFVWVKTEAGSQQKRTEDGNDRLSKAFKYDHKGRVIEEKSYNSNFDDENMAYLYKTELRHFEGDLLKIVQIYHDTDQLVHQKTYQYDSSHRKIKEILVFPKNPEDNISLTFTYQAHQFPVKLVYTVNKASYEVNFEYVFDDRQNWISQTKSVNGKPLYVWKRELTYFE